MSIVTFLKKQIFLSILVLLISKAVFANDLEDVLKLKQEPAGVIFEIIESSDNDWDWVIPKVANYTEQLRLRFPGLDVVMVSHGREQFMLLKSEHDENKQRQQALQSLISDKKIDVHVCAVHGSWYGNTAEDFVDFIDVAASAPAQINDYTNLGYELIVLEKYDELETGF